MSIELRNVSKNFGEVTAARNISFTVREGELVALPGPAPFKAGEIVKPSAQP